MSRLSQGAQHTLAPRKPTGQRRTEPHVPSKKRIPEYVSARLEKATMGGTIHMMLIVCHLRSRTGGVGGGIHVDEQLAVQEVVHGVLVGEAAHVVCEAASGKGAH
jgi:hypothetical protein